MIFLSHAWGVLAGIGTMSMLAWMLGPEGRGAYAVCALFGTFMGVVFTFGVDRAAQFYVKVNEDQPSQWFWGGLLILGIGVGLGSLTGYVLVDSSYDFFQKAEPSAFRLALWIIPLSVVAEYFYLQSEGLRRFKQLAIFTMVQTIGIFLVTLCFLYFFRWGVEGALLGQVFGYGLIASLVCRDLFKNSQLSFRFPQKTHMQSLFSYGARFYPARIGNLLAPQLAVFYLAILGSPKEIGIFAAASALTSRVGIFPLTFETALFPRIAKNPMGSFDLIDQSVRAAFFVTALPMAFVLTFSVPLVAILLSPEFFPAIPLLWVLALGVIVKGGTLTLVAFFRAINSPEIPSISMVVEILISSVAFVISYLYFGLSGGAWAITLGNVCSSIFLLSTYVKVSHRSIGKILCPTVQDITLLKQFILYLYRKCFGQAGV